MSTLAEISIPKSRHRPISRILLWLLLVVAAILAGGVGYAYYTAHSALPQLDGRLAISGLGAPVTVTRDGHGVPTIEAANLEDLFVVPEHRGHGVGRALFERLAQTAVERGCGRLEWAVLDWNKDAIRFYEGLGAKPNSDWTVYRLAGESLHSLAGE